MGRIIDNTITNKGREKAKHLVRILIADDYRLFRQVLRKQIEREDDLKVVAEAVDGREAVKLTKKRSLDVILMDINMPIMDGIEATRKIIALGKQISIIGFSLQNDKCTVNSMLKAGAVAYITKGREINNLCEMIRKVAVPNHR